MQTHTQLMFEQLDLLMNMLAETTGALFAKPNQLNAWQCDDIHALAYAVDVITERYLTTPQRLNEGYSLVEVGDDLLGTLDEILERSAALLNDDRLPTMYIRRLQQINTTGYDMFTIVNEVFAL